MSKNLTIKELLPFKVKYFDGNILKTIEVTAKDAATAKQEFNRKTKLPKSKIYKLIQEPFK